MHFFSELNAALCCTPPYYCVLFGNLCTINCALSELNPRSSPTKLLVWVFTPFARLSSVPMGRTPGFHRQTLLSLCQANDKLLPDTCPQLSGKSGLQKSKAMEYVSLRVNVMDNHLNKLNLHLPKNNFCTTCKNSVKQCGSRVLLPKEQTICILVIFKVTPKCHDFNKLSWTRIR